MSGFCPYKFTLDNPPRLPLQSGSHLEQALSLYLEFILAAWSTVGMYAARKIIRIRFELGGGQTGLKGVSHLCWTLF